MIKFTKISAMVLFFIICVEAHSQVSNTNPSKPQIALLGTFHFAGSNDLLSLKIDDLATEKRQKEIQDLIDKIKKFNPTKIVLEYAYGKTKLDSLYQLYRKGEHELSINERQQIGFRLAKQLGHEHIYVADHMADLPFDELMQLIGATGQMDDFNAILGNIQQNVMVPQKIFYDTHNLSEFFVMMNSDLYDKDNRGSYFQYMMKYDTENNNVGVRIATAWWGRNLQIMSNIDRIIEPEDRAFVLFGQGHTSILKQFYQDRTDIQYVEIEDYLKK